MSFINSIPYKLGTSISEINIDLELKKKCTDNLHYYKSYRYSEIFLFERIFEGNCCLWFNRDVLETINYKFHIKFLSFFEESINAELPGSKKLLQDPNIKGVRPYIYINGMAISLAKLNENYFILLLSCHPSLPIVKPN